MSDMERRQRYADALTRAWGHDDWDAEPEGLADVVIALANAEQEALLRELRALRGGVRRLMRGHAEQVEILSSGILQGQTEALEATVTRLRARVAELEARPSGADVIREAADEIAAVLRAAEHWPAEFSREKGALRATEVDLRRLVTEGGAA